MEEMRNAYETLVRKPVRKRPLVRPRNRWKDKFRINLREIVRGIVNWFHQALNRDQWRSLVNMVMNLSVP
jgi:hypothetical protein